MSTRTVRAAHGWAQEMLDIGAIAASYVVTKSSI